MPQATSAESVLQRFVARARRPGGAELFASIVLGVVGYSVYLGLPIILGSFAHSLGLNERQVGWVGSCELLGLSVGSIVTARRMRANNYRKLVLAHVCVALTFNAATAFASTLGWLCALRTIAGFAGGACYSLSLASLSWRGDPTRNSSLFGMGLVVLGSIQLALLPWLDGVFGTPGVVAFLAALFSIAALLSGRLPRYPQSAAVQSSNASSAQQLASELVDLQKVGWACLAAIAVYNVGSTSFWVYVERLGAAGGLPASFVANTLNAANIATLASTYLAWRIARRFGQHRPQVICLLCAAALTLTWSPAASSGDFAARAFLYYQLLTISQVIQLSLLGTVDRSGRLAALMPAAQGIGQCLGPLAGGAVFALGMGFKEQLVMEASFLAIAAAIYTAVYFSLRHRSLTGAITNS